MLDRRSFLGAGLVGASALTFSSVWSQSSPNFGPPSLPSTGFRRMKLGAMEVIALNDGAVRRHRHRRRPVPGRRGHRALRKAGSRDGNAGEQGPLREGMGERVFAQAIIGETGR